MNDGTISKKSLWLRTILVLARIVLAVFILIIVLLLAINIPAVQTFIAGKFIKSIREKTGTEVTLGSLKIALPNTVNINELFVRDKNADTMLYLHTLSVDVSLFGLLKNQVAIKSLTLENVVANIQRKTPGGTFNFQFLADLFAPDTTAIPDTISKPRKPWLIKVDDINMENIRGSFYDARGGIDLRVNLGNFNAIFKEIDLNHQKLNIQEILLKNTSVTLALNPGDTSNEIQVSAAAKAETSLNGDTIRAVSEVFIALTILADKLTIENTNFSLDNNSTSKLPEGIDYAHLQLSNLNARLRNINIDSEGYRTDFESVSVSESCGLNLKMFSANAQFTDKVATLNNLKIETSASSISGDLSLRYPAFNTFLSDLWNGETTVNLNTSTLNANELFLIVPFLANDPYMGKFKNSDILISAKAEGKINDLNIENLGLTILENTILKSKCRLTGLPDINALVFDATIDQFSSNITDIQRFVDPAVFAGLNVPPSIELKGKAKGKLNSVKANVELTSSFGNISANGFYQDNGNARRDTFSIDFTAQNILAGSILADTMLGRTSFSGSAAGSGIANKDISGSLHLDIQDAFYNAYSYKNITLDGLMAGNIISATASSTDTNLNFTLVADADLRQAKQKFKAQLDLIKANLKALNFSETELSVSTRLTAEANYAGFQHADAYLALENTKLIRPYRTVPLTSVVIQAGSAPDSLQFDIKSDVLDGTVSGNVSPENLGKTLQSAYKKYFGLPDTAQSIAGQHMDFTMNVHIPAPIIQLFSPESEALNISHIKGGYKTDSNELYLEMKLPEAMYSGIKIDSLNLSIKGKDESVSLEASLLKLAYDTLKIENIQINEQVNKGIIHSEISTLNTEGKPSYLFANKIESDSGFFSLSFLPDGLILDNAPWKIAEGNRLEKRGNRWIAEQFVFSQSDQSVGFVTNDTSQKIVFGNFALQNAINIIEYSGSQRLLKGNLDGEVIFPVSENEKYINASLSINQLYVRDSLVGKIFAEVKTKNDRMDLEFSFENEQNNMRVTGDIDHLSGTPTLNLDAVIDINALHRLEQISLGYFSEMKGKINGKISVKGTTKKPELKGYLGFNETTFKVNSLNFVAKISDEKILLDQAGIHFSDFVIEDEQSKELTVNGDILTTDFSGFGFDMHLVTKDFQPVNSTVADNPLFYGKLSLDADVKLKGNMENPKLSADVKINGSTDLTYALPGSELQLVTSEGIVEFLDPSQIYDSVLAIQGDYLTDSIISKLTGLDLTLNLEIDPAAKFTVDIDPKSGDFLAISGSAKLNIVADANGRQTLVGVYEVKNGIYQLSFYGLVKKTFTIAPGSTITWSGRPMDADLDITAEYEVRTSSVSLVANETASMSDAEKQTFNQRLPYMVKLNINGFLAEPEISFNIDLPERYLVTYPLVATKLAMLNSEEMTQELNKQVFALLVTGSFMADNPLSSTSSSPTNIASTAARNSVNGILADQLNNISSKYISGVDVNFGLTSYEDYEENPGDIRTEMDIQVSKKLFNDRITVEAMGSFDLEGDKNKSATSSSKTMTGEFAVIYQLTESGEYKLRAYYEDAYDLFDGDISYSGIALIFEKEFDTLRKDKKKKK
jgi:hypothetical protein